MYAQLGYGKGDTILAGVAIGLGCPAYVHRHMRLFMRNLLNRRCLPSRPFLLWKYGKRIRMSSKYAHKGEGKYNIS